MLKENPLLIGNFESLNEEIIKTIGKQDVSSSYISSMLDNFCMDIALRLENAYNKLHQEELCLAYGENIVYDFQHGIRRVNFREQLEIIEQNNLHFFLFVCILNTIKRSERYGKSFYRTRISEKREVKKYKKTIS